MPRYAIQESAEAVAARAALRDHLKSQKMSANALARNFGVRQYTLSRFLTGRTKTISPEIRRIIDGMTNGIGFNVKALFTNARVQRAVAAAWDGSDEGATLIADTLMALAPVLQAARRRA